ncbi:hypothetical protein E4U12_006576 [Claviceps purpurea]|nr:hypothetical protein E4U12_006576 [Claviceps purpurea]
MSYLSVRVWQQVLASHLADRRIEYKPTLWVMVSEAGNVLDLDSGAPRFLEADKALIWTYRVATPRLMTRGAPFPALLKPQHLQGHAASMLGNERGDAPLASGKLTPASLTYKLQ